MRHFLIIIGVFLISLIQAQPSVVTTIRPFELILKEVVGAEGTVSAILPPGASPHSYELRPSDARRISTAAVLVYGAANLDAWVLDFDHPRRIKLMDLLPAEMRREFDDDAGGASDHSGHDHTGTDPHFWTDPLAVRALLPGLAAALASAHPEGAPAYRANALVFAARLDSLTRVIAADLAPVRGHTLVFSHPFFHYFLDRFGLVQALDIERNPGREPTPRQVADLLREMKQAGAVGVFSLPQYSDRAARTVAEAAGIPLVLLDPLGGSGQSSYVDLIADNARRLKEAIP